MLVWLVEGVFAEEHVGFGVPLYPPSEANAVDDFDDGLEEEGGEGSTGVADEVGDAVFRDEDEDAGEDEDEIGSHADGRASPDRAGKAGRAARPTEGSRGARVSPAIASERFPMIVASVEADRWREEWERVQSRLGAGSSTTLAGVLAGSEWRAHIQQWNRSWEVLALGVAGRAGSIEALTSAIQRVQHELEEGLDRFRQAERRVNGTVSVRALSSEYRASYEHANTLRGEREGLETRVADLRSTLETAIEANERLREETEGRGRDLSDTSRLQTLKGALQKLRREGQAMETRLQVTRVLVESRRAEEDFGRRLAEMDRESRVVAVRVRGRHYLGLDASGDLDDAETSLVMRSGEEDGREKRATGSDARRAR